LQNNPLKAKDPYGLSGLGTAYDIFSFETDASGPGAYYGAAIGGAIGTTFGTGIGGFGVFIFAPLGGYVGAKIGELFDGPSSAELNPAEDFYLPHPPPPKPLDCPAWKLPPWWELPGAWTPSGPELRNLPR